MATKMRAIGLVLFCALVTAIAQVLWKVGAKNFTFSWSLFLNYHIILGFVLYGIGALLLIIALKNGELSVLYPIIATSYIWVSLFSMYFLHEILDSTRWTGIAFVLVGVIFIGIGGKNE